jgi:very-short-patch-repair endonuclease
VEGHGTTPDDRASPDAAPVDDRARSETLGDFQDTPRRRSIGRQHPVGPFVLDFYCAQARLAIEIDGAAHDMGDRPERDRARDRWLAERGIATLRVSAGEVMANTDAVVAAICERCTLPLHHPADGSPPHARHGEDE